MFQLQFDMTYQHPLYCVLSPNAKVSAPMKCNTEKMFMVALQVRVFTKIAHVLFLWCNRSVRQRPVSEQFLVIAKLSSV